MKNLGFVNKIIFIVNSLAAFLLLISYSLPYIPPKKFAVLSVLSLGVPLLVVLNLLFLMYWLLGLKKQMLLSLLVLGFGYNYWNSIYKFSEFEAPDDGNTFSVMSFNVRLFNKFNWLPSKTVKQDIQNLIKTEAPDIVCLQEYRQKSEIALKGYYSFNASSTQNAPIKQGQAIFSKFPIVNSGSLEFPNTNNNAIFVDVVMKNDTIRVYTLHLQSSGINTDIDQLKQETSTHLFKKVGSTFKVQQNQVDLFLKHRALCNYKTIVTGDFNNTAYSYIYNKIKGDNLVDTFEAAGNGFGRTYDFKFFPLRIDFILTDTYFKVNGFKTYNVKLSDHYPIKATLSIDKN